MENEVMFIGVDVSKEIEKFLSEKESIITNGMTENEIKAYKLGIKNSLLGLSSIMNGFYDGIVIHTENEKYQCALDIDDLTEMINE